MLADQDKAEEEDKEDGEDKLMMERSHLLITEADLKLGSMRTEIFFRTSLSSKEELLQDQILDTDKTFHGMTSFRTRAYIRTTISSSIRQDHRGGPKMVTINKMNTTPSIKVTQEIVVPNVKIFCMNWIIPKNILDAPEQDK